MYLAVVPSYRSACMTELRSRLGSSLEVFVSPAHLDKTVRSDPAMGWFTPVRMIRLFGGRAFVQLGSFSRAMNSTALIVDLNPRSISSWGLLLSRRVLGRRTLVWGHLYSQAGAQSKTAWLRLSMRRLASGTVSYTYSNQAAALLDLPNSPVWVAPNSLYKRDLIRPAVGSPRQSVVYVGRFVSGKKVAILIRGFAEARRSLNEIQLVLVGDGPERPDLVALAASLGIAEHVKFAGWIESEQKLRGVYQGAFCSVSPGFAGLSLTQSAGFGIPTVVSRDEAHSPEIELADAGAVRWFETDDPISLGEQITSLWDQRGQTPMESLSTWVQQKYSAEAMADGLEMALTDSILHAGEI